MRTRFLDFSQSSVISFFDVPICGDVHVRTDISVIFADLEQFHLLEELGGSSLARLTALLLNILFPAFLLATAANVSSRLSMLAGRFGTLYDIELVGELRV